MNNNNQKAKEKIITIGLKGPNALTILIGIILALTLINLFWTANLSRKITIFIDEGVVETNRQPVGTLREVQPQQEQPSPQIIEVGIGTYPILGSSDAPVLIVEFSCFECPFCARFYQETLPLIKENYINTGKARLAFRDFPLSFHPNAQKAHEAARCANLQGKFWEYHRKLFENYDNLNVDNFKRYAQELGLNTVQFNDCLDSGKMAQEVQKDFTEGSGYGVTGTPTFFINGIKVVGAQPFSIFEQIIEQELNN